MASFEDLVDILGDQEDLKVLRNRSFLDTVEMHKNDGMSEAEIARGYGITTTQLRAAKSIAVSQQKTREDSHSPTIEG